MNHEWKIIKSEVPDLYHCKMCNIIGIKARVEAKWKIIPYYGSCEKFTCEEIQVLQIMES
jgi:hypothetical protein